MRECGQQQQQQQQEEEEEKKEEEKEEEEWAARARRGGRGAEEESSVTGKLRTQTILPNRLRVSTLKSVGNRACHATTQGSTNHSTAQCCKTPSKPSCPLHKGSWEVLHG
jgi:predicted DNA repair protein MutK